MADAQDTDLIEIRSGSAPMSLHRDPMGWPVAVCHMADCGWSERGASPNGAVLAWANHLDKKHREEWR